MQGDWTPQAISRFWDQYSRRPESRENYFSRQVGAGILHLLQLNEALPRRDVLDLGCGGGDLLDLMLARGIACRGSDFSAKSVEFVNDRFKGRLGWGGATVCAERVEGVDHQSQNLITCVEVVEHLLDAELEALLAEVGRLLRPGGYLLVTTPNNEDLAANEVYCPFCDHSFHAVQHVRSFNATSLRELLEESGLEVSMCQPVELLTFQAAAVLPRWPKAREASFNLMRTALGLRLLRQNLAALSRGGSNLVAIARSR